jgi:glycosyltransferase involved in cell wall biosynthesis
MQLTLLVICALAALFWLTLLLLPSQRRALRFLYNAADAPDRLNRAFPADDITAPYAGDPHEFPHITIVAPGRNEGHLLPQTLGSLCSMTYPRFNVVFVDDQSTDNSREALALLAAQHSHLTVIHNTTPPPPGWVGKTWAVAQAEPHTRTADWLLFTDADLVYHPDCLTQAVRLALHRRADLLSMLPSLRYESLGELLGLLPAMLLITFKLPLTAANNPEDPRALVAGGFFLIKGAVYRDLGGHAGVRGQVIEDIAFGQRAKAANRRVYTAATHDLFTARMYEGALDTFNGLKKNAYAGANYHPLAILPITAFLLFLGALVPLYPLLAVIPLIQHPAPLTSLTFALAVVAALAQLCAAVRTTRLLDFSPLTAPLLPPGFAFYLLIFLASVLDHYRGGNTWAGRKMSPQHLQSLANTSQDP